MASDPRREAQARADQIQAFRRELRALDADAVLRLSPEQEAAVAAYHETALAALAHDFDVDRSETQGQLSRGLRLVSLFGAATLVAAITALVQSVWSSMALPAQVTLLTVFPLASLAGVHLAAERERTRYVAGLFALVACGTAWFAIWMTARLLDLPASELLMWPAAAFGIAVAMSYGFRLVFALSLGVLVTAMAAVFFVAGGVPWPTLFDRLEPLTGTAFLPYVASRHLASLGHGFDDAARHTGLALGLGALVLLSNVRGMSLLAVAPSPALALYQATFMIVAVVVLWRAVRMQDRLGVALVAAALAVFLLVRYVDWFWEWLPAWAFFLILAGTALASIALMRRARRRLEPV